MNERVDGVRMEPSTPDKREEEGETKEDRQTRGSTAPQPPGLRQGDRPCCALSLARVRLFAAPWTACSLS